MMGHTGGVFISSGIGIILLTIGVVFVTSSSPGTGNKETDCPCIQKGECPRVYGQSKWDLKELGKLQPCVQPDFVRCCGVTISVVKGSDGIMENIPEDETHPEEEPEEETQEDPHYLLRVDSEVFSPTNMTINDPESHSEADLSHGSSSESLSVQSEEAVGESRSFPSDDDDMTDLDTSESKNYVRTFLPKDFSFTKSQKGSYSSGYQAEKPEEETTPMPPSFSPRPRPRITKPFLPSSRRPIDGSAIPSYSHIQSASNSEDEISNRPSFSKSRILPGIRPPVIKNTEEAYSGNDYSYGSNSNEEIATTPAPVSAPSFRQQSKISPVGTRRRVPAPYLRPMSSTTTEGPKEETVVETPKYNFGLHRQRTRPLSKMSTSAAISTTEKEVEDADESLSTTTTTTTTTTTEAPVTQKEIGGSMANIMRKRIKPMRAGWSSSGSGSGSQVEVTTQKIVTKTINNDELKVEEVPKNDKVSIKGGRLEFQRPRIPLRRFQHKEKEIEAQKQEVEIQKEAIQDVINEQEKVLQIQKQSVQQQHQPQKPRIQMQRFQSQQVQRPEIENHKEEEKIVLDAQAKEIQIQKEQQRQRPRVHLQRQQTQRQELEIHKEEEKTVLDAQEKTIQIQKEQQQRQRPRIQLQRFQQQTIQNAPVPTRPEVEIQKEALQDVLNAQEKVVQIQKQVFDDSQRIEPLLHQRVQRPKIQMPQRLPPQTTLEAIATAEEEIQKESLQTALDAQEKVVQVQKQFAKDSQRLEGQRRQVQLQGPKIKMHTRLPVPTEAPGTFVHQQEEEIQQQAVKAVLDTQEKIQQIQNQVNSAAVASQDQQQLRQRQKIQMQRLQVKTDRQEIQGQRQELQVQRQEIQGQHQEIQDLREEIQTQRQDIHNQRQEIQGQRQELQVQRQDIQNQRQEIQDKREELQFQNHRQETPTTEIEVIEERPKLPPSRGHLLQRVKVRRPAIHAPTEQLEEAQSAPNTLRRRPVKPEETTTTVSPPTNVLVSSRYSRIRVNQPEQQQQQQPKEENVEEEPAINRRFSIPSRFNFGSSTSRPVEILNNNNNGYDRAVGNGNGPNPPTSTSQPPTPQRIKVHQYTSASNFRRPLPSTTTTTTTTTTTVTPPTTTPMITTTTMKTLPLEDLKVQGSYHRPEAEVDREAYDIVLTSDARKNEEVVDKNNNNNAYQHPSSSLDNSEHLVTYVHPSENTNTVASYPPSDNHHQHHPSSAENPSLNTFTDFDEMEQNHGAVELNQNHHPTSSAGYDEDDDNSHGIYHHHSADDDGDDMYIPAQQNLHKQQLYHHASSSVNDWQPVLSSTWDNYSPYEDESQIREQVAPPQNKRIRIKLKKLELPTPQDMPSTTEVYSNQPGFTFPPFRKSQATLLVTPAPYEKVVNEIKDRYKTKTEPYRAPNHRETLVQPVREPYHQIPVPETFQIQRKPFLRPNPEPTVTPMPLPMEAPAPTVMVATTTSTTTSKPYVMVTATESSNRFHTPSKFNFSVSSPQGRDTPVGFGRVRFEEEKPKAKPLVQYQQQRPISSAAFESEMSHLSQVPHLYAHQHQGNTAATGFRENGPLPPQKTLQSTNVQFGSEFELQHGVEVDNRFQIRPEHNHHEQNIRVHHHHQQEMTETPITRIQHENNIRVNLENSNSQQLLRNQQVIQQQDKLSESPPPPQPMRGQLEMNQNQQIRMRPQQHHQDKQQVRIHHHEQQPQIRIQHDNPKGQQIRMEHEQAIRMHDEEHPQQQTRVHNQQHHIMRPPPVQESVRMEAQEQVRRPLEEHDEQMRFHQTPQQQGNDLRHSEMRHGDIRLRPIEPHSTSALRIHDTHKEMFSNFKLPQQQQQQKQPLVPRKPTQVLIENGETKYMSSEHMDVKFGNEAGAEIFKKQNQGQMPSSQHFNDFHLKNQPPPIHFPQKSPTDEEHDNIRVVQQQQDFRAQFQDMRTQQHQEQERSEEFRKPDEAKVQQQTQEVKGQFQELRSQQQHLQQHHQDSRFSADLNFKKPSSIEELNLRQSQMGQQFSHQQQQQQVKNSRFPLDNFKSIGQQHQQQQQDLAQRPMRFSARFPSSSRTSRSANLTITEDENRVRSDAESSNTTVVDNEFKAPKVVQRGFQPILPYSEKDPGPIKINISLLTVPKSEKFTQKDQKSHPNAL